MSDSARPPGSGLPPPPAAAHASSVPAGREPHPGVQLSEIQPLLPERPLGGADAPAGPGGNEAANYWARAKAKAQVEMAKVKQQRAGAWRSAAENLQQVKVAAQEVVAERNSLKEAGRKAWALLQVIDSGPIAKWLARAMVCTFYINQAYEAVETWHHLRTEPVRRRWPDEPTPKPLAFPMLTVCLLLPSALLCACGLLVPLTGTALLGATLYDDALLTWRQVLNIFRYGSRPTELLAKRLAMIGAALLVVAHSVSDQARMRTYAGLLLADERKRPARSKSAALLAGRLLLCGLFLIAGYAQLRRVSSRGGALWQARGPTPRQQGGMQGGGLQGGGGGVVGAVQGDAIKEAVGAAAAAAAAAMGRAGGMMAGDGGGDGGGGGAAMGAGGAAGGVRHHYGVPDSHDNNWQLLQAALCLPLALGWRTGVVCRLLVAVLLLEAVSCWPFWEWYWPTWHHAAHARLHFFLNNAVAGGLVLLQCLGAGQFTVDELLRKQD